jgi:Rnl2 family RNA ligase
MRHLAYPKIPTAEQLGGTAVDGAWVATEKIHGAQLVIASDGRDLRVGKRKAWLRSDEQFFGWQLLRSRFEQAARAALALGGTAVRIYGELYGGAYPHPDVSPVPGATAVQTGVWYSPDIRFAVFDVLSHANRDDHGAFVTYADAATIAADAGLDVVPLLGRGTRRVLDGLPVRFASHVPQLHGLPPLPSNVAEGVVLRPDVRLAPEHRPVLKLKIEEFDERRFDQSRPWNPQVLLPLAELRQVAQALVNRPRLDSARSKVGPSALDQLLDEIVLDVMVDLAEAFPAAVAALTDEEHAQIEAAVRQIALTLQASDRVAG